MHADRAHLLSGLLLSRLLTLYHLTIGIAVDDHLHRPLSRQNHRWREVDESWKQGSCRDPRILLQHHTTIRIS